MTSPNPKTSRTLGAAQPAPPLFDTLKAARNLKNAEFGDKQAVTLVETIQDAQNELATKADLANTELALRTDMEKMEASLRGEMQNQFSQFYWRLLVGSGIISTVMIGIFGLMITFMGVR